MVNMTKTANRNALHKQQAIAATEQFDQYKKFIVEEFIHKFGGSYQMPEQHMLTWRKTFDWTQEREDFIKEKTQYFIHLLPNDQNIYDGPHFFKTLMHFICNYLMIYTCRKEETLRTLAPGEFINRTPYQNQLLNELYINNKIINTRIAKYTAAHDKQHAKAYKKQVKQNKKFEQEQHNRAFKEFARTGIVPETGLPLHTPEQYRRLLIEVYGSEKVKE